MTGLPLRRSLTALAVLILTLTALAGVRTPMASAQEAVVGTADFRNAPQLVPGSYTDRIVTGDSAWYSVVYSNDTPYEFEVSLSASAPTGTELTASFVAPTLETIDGPAGVVSGSGLVYPAGETNVWFLKVSLESASEVGVEYPITISVSGVQAEGVADCDETPGCTFEAEYATLTAELAEAESELEAFGSLETEAAVQAEIENLRGFAETSATLLPGVESRLGQNEATMAQLCAPDPMCETFPDPKPRTPLLGWLIGLAAIAFGAYMALQKLAPQDVAATAPTAPKAPARAPSALEAARRDAKAKRKNKKKRN